MEAIYGKNFKTRKNKRIRLTLKDTCPGYMRLELRANGSKTATTANAPRL